MRPHVFVAAVSLFSSLSFGQATKPATLQTPRQAILEVITARNSGALERHLPDATKKYWSSHLKEISQMLGIATVVIMSAQSDVDGMSVKAPEPNPNFETFSAGPTLARARDPRSDYVVELRIDNDDFENDEDTMDISVHVNSTYSVEQMTPVEPPNIRLTMKREGGVWRFEEIDLTEKVPLGDPLFTKHTVQQESERSQLFAMEAVHDVVESETQYRQRSAGKEFTCLATQLGPKGGKSDVVTEENSMLQSLQEKGYSVHLTDCTANSFRVAAISQQADQPIFCSDQSGTIKRSNKSATDCFAVGEPVSEEDLYQTPLR